MRTASPLATGAIGVLALPVPSLVPPLHGTRPRRGPLA